MGTPGLRLIQDLLAKSVAKWSGDAVKRVKSTEDGKNNGIKIKENSIKVEYIETETDPCDVKIEQDKIKDENPNIKVGLKRKLDDVETEKSGQKKKKKAQTRSKHESCDSLKDYLKTETDDIQASGQKDNKSLIMRLLINSAAKFTVGGDDFDKVDDKKINIKKIQSKKSKKCKEVLSNETETIDDDVKKLSFPLLRNHGDEGHDMTGVKKETKINQKVISSELKVNDIDKHEISKQKTNYKKKFFSPEEDEILQHAIDTENISFKDLTEQLGRNGSSVHTRIRRLQRGNRKFVLKEYSLVEDMLILDKMLERLPGKKLEDLEMHVDSTSPEFLTTLGRTMITGPIYRWGVKLKPWILQHYAGTLNLDIKRMLANYIADTFDNFDSIDWALVVKRPEFAGHTLSSLKSLFYSYLFGSTKKYLKLEPSEVTLRTVADHTNSKHEVTKKVPEKVLIRQVQVIDYFEQYVKKHGITNFL